MEMMGFGEPRLESNQEAENVSYFEKLQNAFAGMCLGIVFVFVALGLAGWNEYRNVAQIKTLNAGRDSVKEGTCSPISADLDLKLVHISCDLTGMKPLGSTIIPANVGIHDLSSDKRTGISLRSNTQVHAWHETRSSRTESNSVGGGDTTVTTYTYSQKWSSEAPKPTANFFQGGRECRKQNRNEECSNILWDINIKLGTHVIGQSDIKFGDFDMPPDMVSQIGTATPITPFCQDSCLDDWKVVGSDLLIDQLGYIPVKRSFTLVNGTSASVLASQITASHPQTGRVRSTFGKWISPYDEDYYIYNVIGGSRSASEMLDDAAESNAATTWVLRILTLIFTIVGLQMLTAPLTVVPDIIPCLGPMIGDLIGCALCFFNVLFGCCCWTFVAGVIWVLYRPIIGAPLLGLMGLTMCLVIFWRGDKVEIDPSKENFGKKKKTGCPECHGAGCDFCAGKPEYLGDD